MVNIKNGTKESVAFYYHTTVTRENIFGVKTNIPEDATPWIERTNASKANEILITEF